MRTTKIVYMLSLIVITISSGYSQVKFAIIGDYGDQYSSHSQNVANMVNSWDIDFILALGENTTTSNIDADVGKYYSGWIKPYNGTYGPDTATVKRFFTTLGNHDYYYPPYGVGNRAYFDYFSLDSATERYYTVHWSSDLDIFILSNYDGWKADSYDQGTFEPDGWTIGSVQEQWLQAETAASTAKFKIVSIHHPPYTDNNYQDGFDFPDARWDYKGMGIDAVLSAHWGNYNRIVKDDLLYLVNGVGGHRLSNCGPPDPGTQYCQDTLYGAILAEISGSTLSFKFYDETGVARDSTTVISQLPVELTSFSYSIEGNIVKLNWETATEINNYGFEIERKSGNRSSTNTWNKIGFVDGNGNSNSPKYYSFEDHNVTSDKYSYRLKQIDNDGHYEYSHVLEVNLGSPVEYSLYQNFPNPFNPSTNIQFRLAEKQMVSLSVFNVLGELVKSLINEEKEAGFYSVTFDGTGLPSGTYIYRLETTKYAANRKMSLVK